MTTELELKRESAVLTKRINRLEARRLRLKEAMDNKVSKVYRRMDTEIQKLSEKREIVDTKLTELKDAKEITK